MKKINKTILFSIGLLLTSCNNFLDRQPISDLTSTNFWKTEKDLKTWNAGIHDGLQLTLRENWFYWGDIRAGNWEPTGISFDYNLLYNGLSSTSTSTSWNELYSTIGNANTAIKYIPQCPVSEEISNKYLAQAYTMRALMYFYAIRVWGDVPMITEPFEDPTIQERYYGRNSIMEIKTLMLEDLDKAIKLFGETGDLSTANKYELNKGAALAIKTDILMWYKDFDEAIIIADDLIKNYGYSLTKGEAFKNQFVNPENSPEIIFSLYWDYTEDAKGFGYNMIASGGNTIKYRITPKNFKLLVERKKINDQRIDINIDTLYMYNRLKELAEDPIKEESYEFLDATLGSNFKFQCPKFIEKSSTGDDGKPGYEYPGSNENNVRMCIYRLADIILLKAEALVRKTEPDLVGAIEIIKDLRLNRGCIQDGKLDVGYYNTPEKVIELILEERKIEFWAEGKYWFDLVRNDVVKKYLDPYLQEETAEGYEIPEGFIIGVDRPENPIGGYGKILWPLNQDVFRKNPKMSGQQNKPYTE